MYTSDRISHRDYVNEFKFHDFKTKKKGIATRCFFSLIFLKRRKYVNCTFNYSVKKGEIQSILKVAVYIKGGAGGGVKR